MGDETQETALTVNQLPVTWNNQDPVAINPYNNIAIAPFDEKAQNVLGASINETIVEIRPDGLIYYPGVQFRNILHEAFGRGAWAVLPKNIIVDKEEKKVFFQGALFVNGQFVAESIGEQDYFPNNPQMSYATAAEAAKTDCLTRCCKDLGIAQELWDPRFVRIWKDKYAIKVWCDYVGKGNGKSKFLWRKKTASKFTWPHKEGAGNIQQKDQNTQKQKTIVPPNLKKLIDEVTKLKDELEKTEQGKQFKADVREIMKINLELSDSGLEDWMTAMKEHLSREAE